MFFGWGKICVNLIKMLITWENFSVIVMKKFRKRFEIEIEKKLSKNAFFYIFLSLFNFYTIIR